MKPACVCVSVPNHFVSPSPCIPGFNLRHSFSNGMKRAAWRPRLIDCFLSETVELSVELVHTRWLFTPKFPTVGSKGNKEVGVDKPR